MQKRTIFERLDPVLLLAIVFLTSFGIIILKSLAPILFPTYYLYLLIGFVSLIFFSQIDFGVLSYFSKHLYVISIFFLILTLVIGQVTRGTIRWIPLGALTLQPAEIIRPFLIIFFANYLTTNFSSIKLIKSLFLLSGPILLIIIQPSLGVAILTTISYLGVLVASEIKKKYLFFGILGVILISPLLFKILAPYQHVLVPRPYR